MRKGYDPTLLLDNKGRMFGFATGADACAEHEVGSKPMLDTLCRAVALNDDQVVHKLRSGKLKEYPQLIDRRGVSHPKDITFVEGVEPKTSEPVAMIHFSARGRKPDLNDRELSRGHDKVIAGAWDEHGFAFKVWGEKAVKQLKSFHASLLAGNGLFAGSFLNDLGQRRLSGVIMVDKTLLRGEHLAAIKRAQQKWEGAIRLEARSELESLYECYSKALRENPNARHIQLPGHIWPVWKNNEVDCEVAYALNPGYGIKASYYGPYELDDLKRWTLAEKKFELTPIPRPDTVNAAKMR